MIKSLIKLGLVAGAVVAGYKIAQKYGAEFNNYEVTQELKTKAVTVINKAKSLVSFEDDSHEMNVELYDETIKDLEKQWADTGILS